MRYVHLSAIAFQLAALVFFVWIAAVTGDWLPKAMAGWCVFFLAYSTAALRRKGLRA